jgi:hypothetical protein
MIPPRTFAGAAGFVSYLLEGIAMLNRTPALAVMDLVLDEPG